MTIDASGNDPSPIVKKGQGSGVFYIGDRFDQRDVTLRGLTITGGDTSLGDGGGIVSRGDLTIVDCAIIDNFGYRGGGIASFGELSVIASTISGNSTLYKGGGIYATSLTMTSSVVANNSADSGGGIYGLTSPSSISDSTIEGNSASHNGGGIYSGSYSSLSQTSLTITDTVVDNNSAQQGGGIYSRFGCAVNLIGCTIHENTAESTRWTGAGVYAGGQLTATRCEFTGNMANGDGGGIYGHLVQVSDSTISGNSAGAGGGGIYAGQAELSGCDISNNSADSGGGGVFCVSFYPSTINTCTIENNSGGSWGGGGLCVTGVVSVDACLIANNSSSFGGGGIFNEGTLTLTNTTITGNTSTDGAGILSYGESDAKNCLISGNISSGHGGGAFVAGGATTFANSTVTGNVAGEAGGGIYVGHDFLAIGSPGDLSIAECSIVGNRAIRLGGGIFVSSGGVALANTILALNKGFWGGDDLTGLIGSTFDVHYCFISTNAASGLAASPVTPDANGNLIGGSTGFIDPRLGPLSNNGGSIMTRALLPGSPAIDAGDPSAAAGMNGVPANDGRGPPFTRVFGGRIDMGAVEFRPNPLPGDYNFNGIVDAADFNVWRDTLNSISDLRADGDGNGVVDAADYQVWVANFGQILPAGAAAEVTSEETVTAEDSGLPSSALVPRNREAASVAGAGNMGQGVERPFQAALAEPVAPEVLRHPEGTRGFGLRTMDEEGEQLPFSTAHSLTRPVGTKMGTDPCAR